MKAILTLLIIISTTIVSAQRLYTSLNHGFRTLDISTCQVDSFCQFPIGTIMQLHFLENDTIIGVTFTNGDARISIVDTLNCMVDLIKEYDGSNFTQSSVLNEQGDIWILGWQNLLKYRPVSNDYIHYGDLTYPTALCYAMTYRDQKLIYTNCEDNFRFMEMDTSNTEKIKTMYYYNHYQIYSMSSFNTDCEDWITYSIAEEVDSINHIPIIGGFRGLIEIDFSTQRFYRLCDDPDMYPILSQESIYYDKACLLIHDLDQDDSSGATVDNYRVSTCDYTNIPLSDDDVLLHSNTRIDSMHIYIDNGLLDVGEERLYIPNTFGQIVTGNNTSDIWIKNLEPYHYADMEEMMRTIVYNNTSINPQTGQRQIHFVAHYRGNESSPAICFLDLLNELHTAGDDHQIAICQVDTPITLSEYLDMDAIQGGTWLPNTAVAGVFTPGIDPPGKYLYTVQPDNCAMDSAWFDVSFDIFSFDLGQDTMLCTGEYIELKSAAIGDYTWSTGSHLSSVMIQDSGIFWLEVLNDQGCIYRDSIHITSAQPSATMIIDSTICEGQIIIWDNQPIAASGVYTIRLVNNNRCDSLIELHLTVLPIPYVKIIGDSIVCQETDITLMVMDTFDTYLWSNGGNTNRVTGLKPGIHTIIIANSEGCTDIDTIIVTEIDPLIMEVHSQSPQCIEDQNGWIQLSYLSGGIEPLSYYINNIDLEDDLLVVNLPQGSYDIEVIDAAGCTWTTTEELIHATSKYVQLGDDATINSIGSFTFQIETDIDTIVRILWLADGDTLSINQSLSYTTVIKQSTVIDIYITDQHGCTYHSQQKITLELPSDLYVPNIFDPNRDAPFFMINSPYDNLLVESFRIYDRWGGSVFHVTHFPTNDITYGWDGTHRNVPCETGIYIYQILYFIDGQYKQKVGDVLLLR